MDHSGQEQPDREESRLGDSRGRMSSSPSSPGAAFFAEVVDSAVVGHIGSERKVSVASAHVGSLDSTRTRQTGHDRDLALTSHSDRQRLGLLLTLRQVILLVGGSRMLGYAWARFREDRSVGVVRVDCKRRVGARGGLSTAWADRARKADDTHLMRCWSAGDQTILMTSYLPLPTGTRSAQTDEAETRSS